MNNTSILKHDLMEHVRGHVKVYEYLFYIIIEIEAPNGRVWRLARPNTERLTAHDIVQVYREYLLSDYFYHER